MQIPYIFVFIEKQYHENFAFLILGILELFDRAVCKFLKKYSLFLNVCKQNFHIFEMRMF